MSEMSNIKFSNILNKDIITKSTNFNVKYDIQKTKSSFKK